MSKDISDLFICHEIGHALYTSRDMLQKMVDRKIDKSYVNIIEDARIERMVQDKYLGTKSCFTKGYNELLSKDFFGLKDKDLNDFNLRQNQSTFQGSGQCSILFCRADLGR